MYGDWKAVGEESLICEILLITAKSGSIMEMKNHIAGILIAGGIIVCTLSSAALTVEDYCSPSVSAPAGIKEMRPLSDGVSYAAISEDGRSIFSFDYKTGKKTGTLFSLDNIKGDLKIDSFDGYQISDNGRKILLWNDVEKIYRHSFTAQYYVFDTMRSTLKRVSSQGAQRGAVMSHDGRMVAYTRDNNIYISNLDYDTDKAITKDGEINKVIYGVPDWSYEEEFGIVNTIRWSSDDNTLAFLRFDESDVPTYSFDSYKSYCDPSPLADPYPSQYTYKYPLAGYPNSVVSVLAYNLDNRTTKVMNLPIGSDYVPALEFDGTGTQLMVTLLNRDQNYLQLFKVNPASTVGHLLLEERSRAWLSPSVYQMVRYGEKSFVIGSERSGYCHLYEYDYNGTLLRQITSGNWNVTAYYGKSPKTGAHYIQTTLRGPINRNIASVDGKGNVSPLCNEDGFESASFSTGMDYYVRTYSNAQTPPRYSIHTAKGSLVKELENNAVYASRYESAPKKEFLTVKNDDGVEMNAYIIKPVDFDPSRRYPLLMTQYNGPDSQQVANRWNMEGVYYLASQGYIVAAVDGRGTGFRSREWAHSVYRNLGKYETADQIAAARHFASLPYIDENRLGCFGWSYGGYMTLMELSAENSPFCAGVAMAPVTDWKFYDSIYTERYMSTPQQNEEGYRSSSAIASTQSMNSRLLIMSGTNDDNVHYYNTLMYASKLNYEGKIFDMMSFAGFEHSLGMCNARAMLFRKISDFLGTHLKKE